jgi:hypothetical protein
VDETEFTFFAILMFTVPVLLDLVSTELDGKLYIGISKIYITINTCLAIFSFAGMFGFFVDMGNVFAVAEKSMIFPGSSFSKKYLLLPLAVDVLIPVMMYHACPSKKTKRIIEHGHDQRKVGSA